jgi:peptide-methionine (S)-S-oxide reductase
MGDHTEVIEIDYDPTKIRYEELLEVFWRDHDPTRRPWSRQYRSLILVHDEAQRNAVEVSKLRYEARTGGKVLTAIEAYTKFTRAEDYHQKYTLRRWKDVVGELEETYPDAADFVDSTSVARLNGYLAGQGDPAQLERELPTLGLSPAAQKVVQERVASRHR